MRLIMQKYSIGRIDTNLKERSQISKIFMHVNQRCRSDEAQIWHGDYLDL